MFEHTYKHTIPHYMEVSCGSWRIHGRYRTDWCPGNWYQDQYFLTFRQYQSQYQYQYQDQHQCQCQCWV